MTTRLKMGKTNPEGYRIVGELDAYCGKALGAELRDLISFRASILNGCSYCVDSHSSELQSDGMPLRKIFAIAAWKESTFFTERERLALELTDAITQIAGGVNEDLWQRASAEFTEKELGDIILAVGTINIWNRIGVSTHLEATPLRG